MKIIKRLLQSIPIIAAATAFTALTSFAADSKQVYVFCHNPVTKAVETDAVFTVKESVGGAVIRTATATDANKVDLGTLEVGNAISVDKIPGVEFTLNKTGEKWVLTSSDESVSKGVSQDLFYPAGTPTFHLPYMEEQVSATIYFEKNLPEKFKDKNVEIRVYNYAGEGGNVTGTGIDGMGLLDSFGFGKMAASYTQDTPIDTGNNSTLTWSNNGERVHWIHTREYSDMVVYIIRGDAYDSVYSVYHPTHTKNSEACIYYNFPEYFVRVKFAGDEGEEDLRPTAVNTTQFVQKYVDELGGNAWVEYDYAEKKLASESGGTAKIVVNNPGYESALMEFDRSKIFLKAMTPSEVDYNWAAYDKVLGARASDVGNYIAPVVHSRASYGNVIEITLTKAITAIPFELYTIWEGDEGHTNLRPNYYYIDFTKQEGKTSNLTVLKSSEKDGSPWYRDLGTTAGSSVKVEVTKKIPWYTTRVEYEGRKVFVIHKYTPITYKAVVEFENDSGHESERPTITINTSNHKDTGSNETGVKLNSGNEWKYSWITSEAVEDGWVLTTDELNSKYWTIRKIEGPTVHGDRTFHIIVRYNPPEETKTTTPSDASKEKETILTDKDGNKYTLKGETKTSTVDGKTYITDSTGKTYQINPDTLEVIEETKIPAPLQVLPQETAIAVAQKLPQTGYEWARVILILCVGIFAVAGGIVLRRKHAK